MPKDWESLRSSRRLRSKIIQKYGDVPTSVWTIDYTQNTLVADFVKSQSKHMEEKYQKYEGKLEYGQAFMLSHKTIRGKGVGLSIYPFDLAKRIITFYTEEGDTIFDPCTGHATRLTAAYYLKRNYIGYDVSAEMTKNNEKVKKGIMTGLTKNGTIELHNRSSTDVHLPDDSVDLVFTSPPYWDLEFYGNEKEQLGEGKSYEEFLQGMKKILSESHRILKLGKYAAFSVNDFRKNNTFYPYHSDIMRLGVEVGFKMHDLIIVVWGSSLAAAFASQVEDRKVTGKMHEYIVVFKKPELPTETLKTKKKEVQTVKGFPILQSFKKNE